MSFSASRIAAGYSLDDVCREFAVPEAIVRAWEAGKAKPPPQVANSLKVIGEMGAKEQPTGIKPAQTEFTTVRDEGPLFKSDKLIKSKKRVADHGEVFTPDWLVEKMLDLVKGETERIDSRFLEPACGSGNFLLPILKRKMAAVEVKYGKNEFEKRHYALYALGCIYGIELLEDNIAECRANMLEVFTQYLGIDESDDLYRAAGLMLSTNLIHGDAMTMRGVDGSPMIVTEWTYIGKGKFNRRDFKLETLTTTSKFPERWAQPEAEEQQVSLFSEPRPAFRHRGKDPIFVPVRDYKPMRVKELAAWDKADA